MMPPPPGVRVPMLLVLLPATSAQLVGSRPSWWGGELGAQRLKADLAAAGTRQFYGWWFEYRDVRGASGPGLPRSVAAHMG